jgi:hypothetical protein
MSEETVAVDELVAVYIKIRNAIKEKEDQHKQELEALKEKFELVGEQLLERCKEQNADSIRTPAGTVSRRISSRYWTSDWESLYKFIKENDAHYLLEKRIHNGNMQQFLEENSEAFPAGLQNERKYVVQVRKPTSK